MTKKQRYFLDEDESYHWYLVPVSMRATWDRWRDLDHDTEEAWDAPEGVTRLDGHPNGLTFEAPK